MVLYPEQVMHRVQIYLIEDDIAALRVIAHQRGVSSSQVIREALDRFIAANDRPGRAQLMSAAFGIWADHPGFDQRGIRGAFDRCSET
jgi:hypothetical protein